MIRGLYTAASGALVAQSMADNVANNLANVTSNGFKQTLLQIQSGPTMDVYRIQTDPGQAPHRATPGQPVAQPVGTLGLGAQIYDTPEDYAQGPLEVTNNTYDLALTGANGFFTIATPQGLRYTRDGQFSINNNGTLVTLDGNPVLDTNGQPITIQTQLGKPIIGTDGSVTQPGNLTNSQATFTSARLGITSFNNLLQLRPEGDSNFVDTGNAQPRPATTVGVQQGSLEKSNFNVVSSMVELITAERWFDANERAIKTQDDATNQLINNVARPQST